MHKGIIDNSELFNNLSKEELDYALKYFNAKEQSYKKGSLLNKLYEKLDFFGLVLEGIVQVYMNDVNGNQILLATNTPGNSFGESLCYLKRDAFVCIKASSDCKILKMNLKKMQEMPESSLDLKLRDRFTRILAERTLQMNDRIHILSTYSLREKILLFFAQMQISREKEFIIPFSRDEMASYLGVNRTALSRELSRMRAEKIIEFEKNTFRLL